MGEVAIVGWIEGTNDGQLVALGERSPEKVYRVTLAAGGTFVLIWQ